MGAHYSGCCIINGTTAAPHTAALAPPSSPPRMILLGALETAAALLSLASIFNVQSRDYFEELASERGVGLNSSNRRAIGLYRASGSKRQKNASWSNWMAKFHGGSHLVGERGFSHVGQSRQREGGRGRFSVGQMHNEMAAQCKTALLPQGAPTDGHGY